VLISLSLNHRGSRRWGLSLIGRPSVRISWHDIHQVSTPLDLTTTLSPLFSNSRATPKKKKHRQKYNVRRSLMK